MNIEELKAMIRNKINILNERRNQVYMSGDVASYEEVKVQIEETQLILDKLNA